MNFIRILAIALPLALTGLSSTAGGTVQATLIKHINYYEGHVGLLIITEAALINPDYCGRRDLYILRNSHPMYKEMTALVISAHMSGQPVSISVNGCIQDLPSVVNISSTK
jgi:hypothetical protein